jgi:hypothetical protein
MSRQPHPPWFNHPNSIQRKQRKYLTLSDDDYTTLYQRYEYEQCYHPIEREIKKSLYFLICLITSKVIKAWPMVLMLSTHIGRLKFPKSLRTEYRAWMNLFEWKTSSDILKQIQQ